MLAVISGHIKLVGARAQPLTSSSSASNPWERLAADTEVGLLGPVQLELSNDAPSEENMLNEIYYARYRSLLSDVSYLLKGARAMFSGRAWSAHGQAGNH